MYKFFCSSCSYHCKSKVGLQKGHYYSEAPMVCKDCFALDGYRIPSPNTKGGETLCDPVCKYCGSPETLVIWDGITCPKCIKPMRSIGNSIAD
jgi:hypothetical protein